MHPCIKIMASQYLPLKNSDLQAGIWFGSMALSPIITFPHSLMSSSMTKCAWSMPCTSSGGESSTIFFRQYWKGHAHFCVVSIFENILIFEVVFIFGWCLHFLMSSSFLMLSSFLKTSSFFRSSSFLSHLNFWGRLHKLIIAWFTFHHASLSCTNVTETRCRI